MAMTYQSKRILLVDVLDNFSRVLGASWVSRKRSRRSMRIEVLQAVPTRYVQMHNAALCIAASGFVLCA